MTQTTAFNYLDALPHRPPMLMIDGIVSLVPGQEATATKTVALDDLHLITHPVAAPMFPGVLIIEALAQTACVLATCSAADDGTGPRRLPYLLGVDGARFRRPVHAGETLGLHVRCIKAWGPFWQLRGQAVVGGALAAEARLMATMVADTREPAAGPSAGPSAVSDRKSR